MVMLFPSTADRAWHYQTTNGQYGQFYGTVIREVQRDDFGRHHDCNKRAVQLAEELQEAKACLEMVDYSWARADQGQYAPRDKIYLQILIPFLKGEHKECSGPCCSKKRAPNSRCKCNHKTPGCYETPYEVNSSVEWNCGQSREPEFLEDHVRHYHPRLAPKLQVLPKKVVGQSNLGEQLQGGAVSIRGVGSGGGCGVGLQSGLQGSEQRPRRASPSSARGGSPQQTTRTKVLPATARYNFYRYYGNAGQGAKTSKDYHPRP